MYRLQYRFRLDLVQDNFPPDDIYWNVLAFYKITEWHNN